MELVYDEELPLTWSSIITVSGGPSWGTAGQAQYLYPNSPVYTNVFAPNPAPYYNMYFYYNSPTSTMANGELFFGLQRTVQPGIIGQLGLGVAGVSDAEVTGAVDLNVPNVISVPNVYSYRYKVNHVRVELKGKLIASSINPVQPYISGSIGAGFNNSHDYQAVSVNQSQFPAPWFLPSTTIAFAYSVGAGVQKSITKNWQVGVGYEFADLGKSYLGYDGFLLEKGPLLTHFYNNQLLFSLSYLYS
jgi:opacity protein-like surface antigen